MSFLKALEASSSDEAERRPRKKAAVKEKAAPPPTLTSHGVASAADVLADFSQKPATAGLRLAPWKQRLKRLRDATKAEDARQEALRKAPAEEAQRERPRRPKENRRRRPRRDEDDEDERRDHRRPRRDDDDDDDERRDHRRRRRDDDSDDEEDHRRRRRDDDDDERRDHRRRRRDDDSDDEEDHRRRRRDDDDDEGFFPRRRKDEADEGDDDDDSDRRRRRRRRRKKRHDEESKTKKVASLEDEEERKYWKAKLQRAEERRRYEAEEPRKEEPRKEELRKCERELREARQESVDDVDWSDEDEDINALFDAAARRQKEQRAASRPPRVPLPKSSGRKTLRSDDDDDEARLEKKTTFRGPKRGGDDAPRKKKTGTTTKRQDEVSDDDSDADDSEFPSLEAPSFLSEKVPLRLTVAEEDLEECGEEPPTPLVLPASIRRYLSNYQVEGVKWLYKQMALRRGGILADDMGLGKTVQTIAFVAAVAGLTGLAKTDRARRRERAAAARGVEDHTEDDDEGATPAAAILVPKATLESWIEAFETWVLLNVCVVSHRESGSERESRLRRARRGAFDVVLTTHSIAATLDWSLGPDEYEVCFVDEFHLFKTKGKTYHTFLLENVKPRSRVLFGLTGTPLQNDNKEAYSLLTLCTNEDLGTEKEFCKNFETALARSRKKGADREEIALGHQRQIELRELYEKYMLRREKSVVLKDKLAAGKQDLIVKCPLSDLQKDMYRRVVNLPDVQILRTANLRCDCNRGKRDRLPRKKCCYPVDRELAPLPDKRRFYFATVQTERGGKHNGSLCERCPCWQLSVIDKLKKIAMHPAMLQWDPPKDDHDGKSSSKKNGPPGNNDNNDDNNGNGNGNGNGKRRTNGGKKATDEDKENVEAFARLAFGDEEFERRGLVRSKKFLDQCRVDDCGKLEMLANLLRKLRDQQTDEEGVPHRVLVFSQSTKMLDIIEAYVQSQAYGYVRVDGQTPDAKRSLAMRKFQNLKNSVFVGLFSTGAGGTGLNLQAANVVVLFDPNWNPASDEQAEDRAFRIGQTRRVLCYRLISQGTIEELVWMRQLYKNKMTSAGFVDEKEFGSFGVKFKAVKGETQGELFGMANMIKFSEDSFIDLLCGVDPKKKKKKTNISHDADDHVVDVGDVDRAAEEKVKQAKEKIEREVQDGVDISKYVREAYDDDVDFFDDADDDGGPFPRGAAPVDVNDLDDDPENAFDKKPPKRKPTAEDEPKPPTTSPPTGVKKEKNTKDEPAPPPPGPPPSHAQTTTRNDVKTAAPSASVLLDDSDDDSDDDDDD